MNKFEECKKAALSGDAEAQFNLGDMYFLGQCVSQDYVESFKWFSEAAKQGHPAALYDVGIHYAKGLGVN